MVYAVGRFGCFPRETFVLFEELSDIFSGCNNQINSRELLMKVTQNKCYLNPKVLLILLARFYTFFDSHEAPCEFVQ